MHSRAVLLKLLIFVVSISKSRALGNDDDSWISSNFPIIAAADFIAASSNLSQKCLTDTKMQLAALQNGLPWAVESKFESFINISKSELR